MTNRSETLIARALEGRHLLSHPFYRRWEAGELGAGELRRYAEQYRHFEAALPGLLETASLAVPEGAARDALRANLADEVGDPTHLALFDRFADHYAARPVAPSPATAALLAHYQGAISHSAGSAVAGILAYEVQGAEIARTKSVGLERHYDAPAAARTFWDVHACAEVDHAAWTFGALDHLGAPDEHVTAGATAVAVAWWAFLDERETAAA